MKPGAVCLILIFSAGKSAVAQEPKASTSCAGLTITLKAEIDRMRKLEERAKKEEKAPPADLLSAWQRTFGKEGDGVPSRNELRKRRQHADGLNIKSRENGCPTIDIDRALGSKP
jgi:hypothetical protein